MAEAKRVLRRQLLARRRAIPSERREAAGRVVAERLVSEPVLREAPRIALYAATEDELPTRPLFEALLCAGSHRLLLPRIVGESLEFSAIEAWDELRPGPYGVLAPVGSGPAEALRGGDVALLPGVAFDPCGHRLGRGGGHYDRAFAAPGPLLMGLAFHLQLVERVPHDSRDRPVDAIVTERELLWVSRV